MAYGPARRVHLDEAADDYALDKNVKIVVAPFAEGRLAEARSG
jgi:hypothetical protein